MPTIFFLQNQYQNDFFLKKIVHIFVFPNLRKVTSENFCKTINKSNLCLSI